MRVFDKFEQFIVKHNPLFTQQYTQKKHILLIPGMSGPAWQLLPLAKYVNSKVGDTYSVTVVPLGFSWDDFTTLSFVTHNTIETILQKQPKTNTIVLIGHSHGGRIAWSAASYLLTKHPNIHVQLITMASPLDYRPKLAFINTLVSRFSKAYLDWPLLSNLDLKKVSFTALYSDKDIVVNAECASSKIEKEYLHLVPGLAHFQFLNPKKIGDVLLKTIKS